MEGSKENVSQVISQAVVKLLLWAKLNFFCVKMKVEEIDT